MKNYVIGVLVVVIVFLGSVVYKQLNKMVCYHFPVPEELKKESADVPLYLFLFFSKDDCRPCIVEMVEVINSLPSQFCAAGIAPAEELKDEAGLRQLIGTSFPLYSFQRFKKYLPWRTPTLFGVSPSGRVIFVLPGIPDLQDQKVYLRNFIVSAYGRLYDSFKEEHASGSGGR
jgi:hypothetical protein